MTKEIGMLLLPYQSKKPNTNARIQLLRNQESPILQLIMSKHKQPSSTKTIKPLIIARIYIAITYKYVGF